MELKLLCGFQYYRDYGLLIVPYGIETTEAHYIYARLELLIVPYGIETRQTRGS